MWHTMTKEEIRRKLRVDYNYGLSDSEAEKRKEKYGTNKLQQKKRTNIFVRFLMQFNDFMIIVLIIAAGVSAVMSYIKGTR